MAGSFHHKSDQDTRVLILDDPADAEPLEAELSRAGMAFRSELVRNKQSYINSLLEFHPDIILSAYDLPDLSGSEALRIVKEVSPETPFIVVDGAVGEEQAVEMITGGAADYILKKNLSRLVPAMNRALRESREYRIRKEAELEGGTLLKKLEKQVEVRTAALLKAVARRKAIKQALGESEKKYRDLVKYAPAAVCEWDIRSRKFSTVNDFMCELSGYSRNELLNMDIMDLLDKGSQPVFLERISRMLAGEKPDDRVEYKIRLKNNRVIVGLLYIRFLEDESGKIIGSRIVAADITERKEMEEALGESEKRFRKIFEQAPLGIALAETQTGKIIAINPKFCEIIGHSEDALRKTDFRTLTYPEDLPATLGMIEQLTAGTRSSFNLEKRYIRSDGSITWVNLTVVGLGNTGELPLRHIALVEDINARKQAEEALLKSEENYRLIFETSLNGILFTRPDGSVISANPAAQKMLGMTEEEIIKAGREGIIDLTDPRLGPALEERSRTGKFSGELNYKGKDGKVFTAEGFSVVFEDNKGQVFSSIMFQDVTWRAESERKLKESEQRFREMADAMPQLVWTATPKGRIDYFNRRHEEFSGVVRKANGYWKWTQTIHPEDLQPMLEAWQRAFEMKSDAQVEHRLKSSEGEYRWHICRFRPIRNESGQAIKWIGTTTDVHDMKEIEASLKEHTKLVEEANKELESFTYSVSHDLRAPLRAIDGFSAMLMKTLEKKFDEEERRKFDLIRNNAQKMNHLIDDLLALSRIGRTELTCKKMNMNKLAESVWTQLSAANPKRALDLKIADLPEAFGDTSLIFQVFSNLLANAVKYTRKRRKPLIEIGGKTDGREAVYYIKDNGAGFNMRYYDKLFNVFQRLHPESDYEGTGIGLAIVHRIIKRHGGRVWAEGKVGKGATFYFSLPRR